MTDATAEHSGRFQSALDAAREQGEVRDPDRDAGVFLFGPITIDTVWWVSEREDLKAVSRVERDDSEWMTVMVE